MNDVTDPAHYAGDGEVDCARALRSMMDGCGIEPMLGYWWGCIFKYVWRWPKKNGIEDLRKARECLDRMISLMGARGWE